ncbi:uncharacterized protein [Malus domestica]|uniref:uncharacterized protein n=1 Tax=Malus domestica TaxID=3750 RepID=UPI003975EA2A
MVMACVKSVSYSFLINRQSSGYLIPSCGLRQGDPLSPYLFLLCVEGLSALISHREQLGQVSGIWLCEGAPTIHHLLFADDSFLFGKTNVDKCAVIQHILDIYSQASSQSVNFAKSTVAFSANVLPYDQKMLACFLGVQLVERHERPSVMNFINLWLGFGGGMGRRVGKSIGDRGIRCVNLKWKSIIKAREVLVRGSRWVVGDGQFIRVWLDRWVPRPGTFKILSTPPLGRVQMKVDELIDTSSRVWRTDLLSEFFSPEEVSLILSLPLSFRAPEDRLMWHYDEKGFFSVKSGYWVAQQWLQSPYSSASSSNSVSAYGRLLKHIWKGNIPPKVKNFTWMIAHMQGAQRVVIESDSLKVISVLNGTVADSSGLGMIVEDVLQLASIFSRVKFIHASRFCNGFAHCLAKFALVSSNNLVWFEEPPTLIQELLFEDICNSG